MHDGEDIAVERLEEEWELFVAGASDSSRADGDDVGVRCWEGFETVEEALGHEIGR